MRRERHFYNKAMYGILKGHDSCGKEEEAGTMKRGTFVMFCLLYQAAAEAFPEKVLFEQRCEGANQGRRERKNVLERENNKYKSLEPGLLGMPKNSDEARVAEAK